MREKRTVFSTLTHLDVGQAVQHLLTSFSQFNPLLLIVLLVPGSYLIFLRQHPPIEHPQPLSGRRQRIWARPRQPVASDSKTANEPVMLHRRKRSRPS